MSQTPDAGASDPDQTPSAVVNAAAHAYEVAMEQQTATPPAAMPITESKDTVMADNTPDRHEEPPAILPGATSAASPAPHRVGTPSRTTNGHEVNSRAASLHPDPAPTFPKEARPHGAPARQYLNSKVTTVLLEGMKQLAKDQPKDPLRVLGEYLLQRSKEIEGT